MNLKYCSKTRKYSQNQFLIVSQCLQKACAVDTPTSFCMCGSVCLRYSLLRWQKLYRRNSGCYKFRQSVILLTLSHIQQICSRHFENILEHS